MTPEQVRELILKALQFGLAEAVINGDDVLLSRMKIASEVVRRIPEEQINSILVDLFKELVA